MLAPALALVGLSLALAWSVFAKGGVWPQDWDITLCAVGCISAGYWLFTRPIHRAPPLSRRLRWPILLLLCYLAFQLIPLPIAMLQAASPARAQLIRSLKPITAIAWAPLSVNPPAAVLALFTIVGCIATFFLVRELAWRWNARPWTPLLPLAAVAVCQAVIGLLQAYAHSPFDGVTGTYTNRDHFAGFLEMVLPITAIRGFSILRSPKTRSTSAFPALAACAWWAISALLLLGIVYSLSRTGFLVALCMLFFVAALSLGPRLPSRMWRRSALTLIGAVVLLTPLLISPVQLIERFAAISSTEKISADTRLLLWKETLPVISEFRLFGTGLGGFESAFLKYQATVNSYRVEFAHNDYLQYIAELGFLGAALLAAIAIGIVLQTLNGILKLADEDRRLVVIGCAGSLLAMLLHSLVDFNTRIPANAMTLVWIAAVASTNASIAFPVITSQPASRKLPVSLHDQGRERKGRGCTPPDTEGTR